MHSPISKDALQLLQEGATEFIKDVDRLSSKPHRKTYRKSIRITLALFYDNPILLYAALWYAASRGVAVRVEVFQKDGKEAWYHCISGTKVEVFD